MNEYTKEYTQMVADGRSGMMREPNNGIGMKMTPPRIK
jgi:hypothetical protein